MLAMEEYRKKVLILLSSYNGERYINSQIDSLLSQEDVDIHILIRDDGSSDKTVKIIESRREATDKITLVKGKNLGFAMSFLDLLLEAHSYLEKYDYYALCDQDDVWLPKKLISAVSLLQEKSIGNKPNLYWGGYTLVDENLEPLYPEKREMSAEDNDISQPVMTKPTILVRYFMLGCTMVIDRNMVDFIYNHQPKGKISMHDLWLSQTAIFFGNVIYDHRPFLLYRQHGNNAAGIDNSKKARWKRLKKSFKTYERRHFRELNAKNLLSAYNDILTPEDHDLISTVANYRSSIKNRFMMLMNKEINMGSKGSDMFIKLRVLLGLL